MATLVSILFGAVAGMTGTLLVTQQQQVVVRVPTENAPAKTAPAPAPAPAPVAARPVEKPAEPAINPCADLVLPARPTERVSCTTAKALLQITGQSKPLVVGGTMVRVLSAKRSGSSVLVRLRVRNETKAEQGVQAGGQELYLNVGGRRIDAARLSSVRLAPESGTTVQVRYVLTMAELDRLAGAGGSAELGVKPWDGTAKGRVVGVIRMLVRS
jgi:hypothetical protein